MRKFLIRIIGILGSFMFLMSVIPLSVSAAELPEPAHSKTVALNEDGTYTLTLDVTGEVISETNGKPADILLIVDTSGSMGNKLDGDTRLGKVQKLVSHLAKNVLWEGSGNQMAVVSFHGSKDSSENPEAWNDSQDVQDWTNSASAVASAVNSFWADGGTNWEAGFREGKMKLDKLGTDRTDSKKYVIFLSDGNPTFYYDENGITQGDGKNTTDTEVSHASAAAQLITGTTFYSVGIGGNTDRMQSLAAVMDGTYKNGTATTALDQIFAEIESQIVKNYKGVTISDTLSTYADIVNPNQYVLSAAYADGTEAVVPEGTNVTYDDIAKKITWTFPADYALKKDVIYSIRFTIQASQEAKNAYVSAGRKYPHTGDAGTGEISDGKEGFYSNDAAEVTYNGNSACYPMPVIQVKVQNITELPKAGGPGVLWLYALGIGMIGFAGSLLIIQKRRQQRESRRFV